MASHRFERQHLFISAALLRPAEEIWKWVIARAAMKDKPPDADPPVDANKAGGGGKPPSGDGDGARPEDEDGKKKSGQDDFIDTSNLIIADFEKKPARASSGDAGKPSQSRRRRRLQWRREATAARMRRPAV
ncbi:MAG: hypothetical protein ACREC0_03180 [Methylocella sp.]